MFHSNKLSDRSCTLFSNSENLLEDFSIDIPFLQNKIRHLSALVFLPRFCILLVKTSSYFLQNGGSYFLGMFFRYRLNLRLFQYTVLPERSTFPHISCSWKAVRNGFPPQLFCRFQAYRSYLRFVLWKVCGK